MLALAICCWSDDPGCGNGDRESAIDSIPANGRKLISLRATSRLRLRAPKLYSDKQQAVCNGLTSKYHEASTQRSNLYHASQSNLDLPSPDHAFTGLPFRTDNPMLLLPTLTMPKYQSPGNHSYRYSRFYANPLCFALPADNQKAEFIDYPIINYPSSKLVTAPQENVKKLVIHYYFTLVHYLRQKKNASLETELTGTDKNSHQTPRLESHYRKAKLTLLNM